MVEIIQKLISQNKTREALQYLSDNGNMEDEITMLKGNFNRITSDFRKGIITKDEFDSKVSQLNYHILEIISLNSYGKHKAKKHTIKSTHRYSIYILLIIIASFVFILSNKFFYNEIDTENFIGQNYGVVNLNNNNKDTTNLTLTQLPNATSDLKKDMKLSFDTRYLTRYYNIINFLLSNPNDRGIIVVEKIFIEIIESHPFFVTSFPEGPSAPMPTHEYSININPNQDEFLITDSLFKYGSGDIDNFFVDINSDSNYVYKIRVGVKHFDIEQSKEKRTLYSEEVIVSYPKRVNWDELFPHAKKIDLYLHDGFALMGFSHYLGEELNFGKNVRLILPNKYKDRSVKSRFRRKFIPMGIFNSSININSAVYNGYSQFVIIDDELVIQHIGKEEAQLISDKETVSLYVNFFKEKFKLRSTVPNNG